VAPPAAAQASRALFERAYSFDLNDVLYDQTQRRA